MTASAGSVFKNFALQLNAAILALSINATSVAFGDVVVNTSATQSVTLTSTGTVPVTINAATLTGTGFTLPGAAFPATLSPGQEATLNIEFDPAAVGAATGQLTITSNSSANGTATIGLSGTGTAAPVVAVAVTPATVSATTGATQQFTASVTGSSDTTVTWTMSGSGCSGTACGTISSSGLYTAPAAVPSSATVTIAATSQSDPTKLASADVTIVPPQAAGYNLAWEDTFSTLSLCTTNVPGCNWYAPGAPWTDSSNGIITDPSGTYVNLNWASTQNSSFTNMTTASMNGAFFHAWTYGYFEVSMAFDPATGNWPAIWMHPLSNVGASGTVNGVNYGEIDLFEWQSTTPTTFYGSAHVWKDSVSIVSSNDPKGYPTPENTNFANYNRYGVLWTPTSISWYFNNILLGKVNTNLAPYSTVFGGSQPYFLLLSEQAGCNWVYAQGSSCPGQVSPLNMQVQWVHVYALPAI
jgi:beta-glucanase (GH16 family)